MQDIFMNADYVFQNLLQNLTLIIQNTIKYLCVLTKTVFFKY